MSEYTLRRLVNVLSDRDENTTFVIRSLMIRWKLSDGDLEYARECAMGPGVKSPTRVAVATLRKRGQQKGKP